MKERWAALNLRVRLGLIGVAVLSLLAAPFWGPALLSTMSFFRVRRVEVLELRYLSADDVYARLRVDTTRSIWDDLDALEQRLREHPQVRDVRINRKMPGTLVVRIEERLPVALVQAKGGLRAVDEHGTVFSVDPTVTKVDLPLAGSRDTLMLRLLGDLRDAEPRLFARVSEIRRGAGGDWVVQLANVRVLAPVSVTADRFADIVPIEADLARRNVRAFERSTSDLPTK